MSSKQDRRRRAREARLAAERQEQESFQRQRRIRFTAIGIFVVVTVGAVIAISQMGADQATDVDESASEVESLLDSIPQEGTVLGRPDAPHTLTEFGDLQCPFCKQFSNDTLPKVINEFVRPGELKIDFQALTFIGPESEDAARMAAAVGEQGHYWDFVDLFYRNQGVENTGYVDDGFLTEIASAIPGVDADKALAERDTGLVTQSLEASSSMAEALQVESTPSFAYSSAGEEPQPFEAQSLDPDEFVKQIEGLISGN